MKLIRVGVDLAKSVFQVHGVDRSEKAAWRRKLSRAEWIKAVQQNVPLEAEIGMEACGSAHHWARQLRAFGYSVKLIAPQFVKPYVKSNKNDATDAEAICEAMSRPGMRFVSVKTVDQQDVQAAHRIRSELMDQRKAKVNQMRPDGRVWPGRSQRDLASAARNTALVGRPGEGLIRGSEGS